MANNLYGIDKLDDKNYDVWSVQMRAILIHSESWRIACGDIKRPVENSEEWEIKDEKALGLIILAVKPTQFNYIKQCKSAAEACLKLKEIYEPKGPARKVTLFKKLLNLRLSEDMNIVKYLNDFSNMVDKLTGFSLSDETKVIILLASLPESYENFVVVVEMRDELPNFLTLKSKLLEEAERRS
ncbi:hypothetical protein KR222_009191 [Zaprionus bogoriensis]|nr:hypothetical protein KR222_009191 [Zaprionus bogoriensis]